ncbi:MAG: hypothetical protein II411_00460 [Lachnospiraceae bacterium]|nr:hypothetical protein [Lachnospiraceae bacterium]
MNRAKRILSILIAMVVSFVLVVPASSYWHDDEEPVVYQAYWDNRTARWNVDGRATKFEVVLYRDGRRVNTRTVTSTSVSFASDMSRGSYDYYFEVRPYNYYTGWGQWVESDTIYIDGSRYYDDDYYDSYRHRNSYHQNGPHYSNDVSYAVNEGPPVNQNNNQQPTNNQNANAQNITVPDPQWVYENLNGIVTGSFVEAFGGWHFLYVNGVYATNAWVNSNGKWYYVDLTGTMVRGLYTINGVTYYLNQDGSMATGAMNINGTNHYFDSNGAMLY